MSPPLPSTILTSRLQPPLAAKDELLRPRLFEVLDQGLLARLTLLAVPAGYGKTTALAQWARQVEHPLGWLTLDARDNQPRSFLRYLVAALQGCQPGIGQKLTEMLDWQQLPEPGLLLDLLLQELAGLDGIRVLVLDEWQLIDNPEIEGLLGRLLQHLPRSLHVYLGSRHRPDFLPLVRLRAARELVEPGAARLALGADEIEALLGERAEADGVCLMRQTQGWPLGLQLLRLACGADALLSLPTGAESELSAYLLAEILLQLPADLQDFLLLTAAVPHFNAELAQVLSGRDDAAGAIQELLRRNLFVQAQDQGYAYHPVFVALLRERLASWPAARLTELYLRACSWYAAQGLHHEAIEMACLAGQPQAAAVSLNALVPALVLGGEVAAVLGWLGRWSQAELLEAPRLCVYYGCALVQSGRIEEAAYWLQRAREHYASAAADYPVLAQLANIETTLAHARNDLAGMLAHSEAALDPALLGHPEATGIAWYNRGMACLLHGRLAEAGAAFGQAADLMPQAADPLHGIDAAMWQARILLWRGQLAQARGAFEALIAQARTLRLENLGSVLQARLGLAEIQLVHLEYAALDRQLASLDLQAGPLRLRAAWLRWQANQRGQALQLLETGDQDPAAQLLAALIRGDALHQALPPLEDRLRRELGVHQHLSLWILVQALQRDKQTEAAASWMQRWLKAIAPAEARHLELVGRTLAAPEPRALRALLEQGAAEGYLWPFIGWLPPAQLQQAIADLPRAYAQRLKAQLPESASLLSPREREILQLMQAGLSNQDISDKLIVSLNTIKTHTKHIYEKLGVTSRSQALMKAIEQGLI
ncbi:MAG: LuxR C-terminal-related transcriptional regulator [Candidatus Sericytochromatia bacterium]